MAQGGRWRRVAERLVGFLAEPEPEPLPWRRPRAWVSSGKPPVAALLGIVLLLYLLVTRLSPGVSRE